MPATEHVDATYDRVEPAPVSRGNQFLRADASGPMAVTAAGEGAAASSMRNWPLNRRLFYPLLSLLLVAPIAYMIYRPAANGLDVTGHQIGRDFINVWIGPQLAFSGRVGTLFDLDAYHAALGALFGRPLPFHNWGYPLFTLPAFWPLAQLPYFWALAVWTVGLFAAFAAVVVAEVDHELRIYAALALLSAPACLINIIGGQNGFLSAALFLGGILSVDRRPVLAGILFGLLTFKPHLGILLPFVLITLGAWRVIASATVTAAVLVLASVGIFGIEPWRQYLEVTSAFQVHLMERFHGFYIVMMTSVLAGGRTVGLPYGLALALQIAVALPVVAVTCWAVRRTADPCRRAFVLASAAPLVTPYAFNYDLTALAAALVWMLCGRLPWHARWRAVYLLAWIAPIALMYLNTLRLGLAPLVLIAMFAVAVLTATEIPVNACQPERPEPCPRPASA